MTKNILKPIVIGLLVGAFIFFTGPLLFIILILKFIFTPFGNFRKGFPSLAFAEKIRMMSDEDYANFQTKFQQRSCKRRCSN